MKNSTRVKQDLIQAVNDGFINYQQLAVACLEVMSDKQVKDMCINNDFKLELDDDTTQGFIVESGTSANIGYNIDREVFDSYPEAKEAFDKKVDEFMLNTKNDNDMNEEDYLEYCQEVQGTSGNCLDSIDYLEDTDGEWYVKLVSVVNRR